MADTTLVEITPGDTSLTPLLAKTVGHENLCISGLSLKLLVNLSATPPDVLDGLIRVISNYSQGQYLPQVLQLLSLMGERAGPAAPVLMDRFCGIFLYEDSLLLSSDRRALDKILKRELRATLLKMPRAAIPELITNPRDGRCTNNMNAIRAKIEILGEIGPITKDVIPALVKILKDQNDAKDQTYYYVFAPYAVRALGQIGPEAESAVPELIRALSHYAAELRKESAEALGRIKTSNQDAHKALTNALNDSSVEVRKAAREVLDRIRSNTR